MMRSKQRPIRQTHLMQALAEFRFHLRSFLQFSEQVARKQQLHPRQHQLLLQIAGISEGHLATINFLAKRLGLRQNSVVELANRSVAEGLVRRSEDPSDRRRVILSVTPKGDACAGRLVCEPCARVGRVRAEAHSHVETHQDGA